MSVYLGEYPNYLKEVVNLENELIKDCYPCEDCPDFVYKRGNIPVILTAPHATCHIRKDLISGQEYTKYEDVYTGPIVQLLHKLTGAHIMYTNWKSRFDPAKYQNSPFRASLKRVIQKYNIKTLIDIHGMPENLMDIDLGTGGVGRPYLRRNQWIYHTLSEYLKKSGIAKIGDNCIFAARSETLSKFAAGNLDINAVQIEISRKYRRPEVNPLDLARVIKALSLSITDIGNRLIQIHNY